ncbi:MAG TPA: phage major capsid protein [Burkholderiales bacterium]|nr:phage major capsid protein [Burkholderiales bacterium]
MTTATKKPTIAEILAKPDFREGVFNRASVKKNERTVEISFSSEEAKVARWFGKEILSHARGAVNLERFNSGRANLLVNHDPSDWVGVIESARVDDDKVGRAVVRFGNSERANEVFQDVQDGILTSVSVGYSRDEMRLTKTGKDEDDEYTVTRWSPFEASLVTIPADQKVGVGRAAEGQVHQPAVSATSQESPMTTETRGAATQTADDVAATAAAGADAVQRAQETVQKMSAVEMEKARRSAIEKLCKANKLDDRMRDTWISQGYTIDQVADDILLILEERGRSNPQPASRLGLTTQETQRFSLSRAILAAASKDNDWSKAGFELECSRSVAQRMGKIAEPHKFYVPFEVIERPLDHQVREYLANLGRRDLTVATAGAGGFLVSTENMGFIEMLRNRSVAFRLGARRLSGLQGSVTVPRQSAAATAVWLANEASTATESQQTFVQMALAPKNVGAYTEISRQLMLQSSPGAEGIVTDDLAQVVSVAVDLATLEGTGSGGQPTGISATAGIGSVTGTSLAAAGVLEFQADIAGANVTPMRPGYATTPAVAALLMVRPELPSTGTTRLWTGNLWDGALFGMPAMSSNQLTAASMIFGDWQEVVVGEWGVLEVEVNPYANFQAGIIGVRAIYSMDVGVRRPFAFSRATSIT